MYKSTNSPSSHIVVLSLKYNLIPTPFRALTIFGFTIYKLCSLILVIFIYSIMEVAVYCFDDHFINGPSLIIKRKLDPHLQFLLL